MSPPRHAALLVVAALLLGALGTALRLPANRRYDEVSGYEDRYYLPAPAWLVVMSLGYRETLADLIWMRTLVYYGDEMTHQGTERHVFDYVEAVLELDPDYLSVYRRVGTLAIYRPSGQVSVQDAERTVAIMERGVERFPDDGPLAWTTGATLAFELPTLYAGQPAEQDRARTRASPYLVRASELGAAPAYVMLANASVLARVGRASEAAAHLEEMYAMTDDESLRAEIATRIRALRSDAFSAAFVEENERFEAAWGRQMPYAPAALYDLVGPIPVIDTRAAMRDGFGVSALGDEPALE